MEPASEPHTVTPRIYVACLAAYNNGILHGAWIDAHQDAWSIYDAVAAMLRASPIPDAEEWAIHDHEGFEGVRIGESEGIERVAQIAAFIVEHGKVGAELITYYGGDVEEATEAMSDRYAGSYATLADFAEEITEETTTIPKGLRFYIDWQAMARDLEVSDVIALGGFGQVHVFWSR